MSFYVTKHYCQCGSACVLFVVGDENGADNLICFQIIFQIYDINHFRLFRICSIISDHFILNVTRYLSPCITMNSHYLLLCYPCSRNTHCCFLFHFQERERDHFSQFITESFTLYCKRKRRDKVSY